VIQPRNLKFHEPRADPTSQYVATVGLRTPAETGYCRAMLIAEDLYLLLLTATIQDSGPAHRDELALAGAVLVELDDLDRLAYTEEKDGVEAGRVLVMDEEGTGHPALDGALRRLLEVDGSLPQDAVVAMADGLTGELVAALTESGLLETTNEGAHRLSVQAEHSAENLRAELRDLLRSGSASEPRLVQLLGLLAGADLADAVLAPADKTTDVDELASQELRLTEGVWIRDVVTKAIGPSGLPGSGGPLGAPVV
jgi:hypothetical protein